jgi:pyridinium-3,5-biscarboxylic acid mononucleotide synthase
MNPPSRPSPPRGEGASVVSYEELGFAKGEPHRISRQGFPEAIYCPGKTLPQIVKIFEILRQGPGPVLATRATPEVAQAILEAHPEAVYHETARLVVWGAKPVDVQTKVLVMTAGTADLPVAEEAAVTAESLGRQVTRIFDVGVAGMHRLMAQREKMETADVAIVCAGMEGALASVVGGIVRCPVIAVPTSVGYGAHFEGLAPLLTMMNSCASNVSVVNIDNGFSAGVIASLITAKKASC